MTAQSASNRRRRGRSVFEAPVAPGTVLKKEQDGDGAAGAVVRTHRFFSVERLGPMQMDIDQEAQPNNEASEVRTGDGMLLLFGGVDPTEALRRAHLIWVFQESSLRFGTAVVAVPLYG